MMRKRNSYPTFAGESTNEKRERKSTREAGSSGGEESDMDAVRTENGRSGEDEEMINVVDVSDSEERMDVSEGPQSTISISIQNTPGPSIVVESTTTSISSLSTASSVAASLPLDLSKKKRRLTASTSLTEDSDHKHEDGDYSDSDQRQRKGIAGFSGTRGGSFGAGTSSSSSTSSTANIKWRRQPLECETPSRGQSPSVIVGGGGIADIVAGLHQQQHQSAVNRNASEAWQIQQQQSRPSVIRSADFTFEPPESHDVDEHFRKSLGGQGTTEADAKVDDHFARALGDVWYHLKNRMHLTSTGEDGPASRSSPSPASVSSSTVSNCIVVNSSPTSSSSLSQSTLPTQVANEISTMKSVNHIVPTTTFPCSTPLKKRILSKAAIEAAAERLEMNNMADNNSSTITNNTRISESGGGQDNYSDRINNNTVNNNSDEDSRKSLSAPSTPPPTPL